MIVPSERIVSFSANETAESFMRKFIVTEEFVVKAVDYVYHLAITQISKIDKSADRFMFECEMVKAKATNTGNSNCCKSKKFIYTGYFNGLDQSGWMKSK